MKVAIGCDEAACALKDIVKAHLVKSGHDVVDHGTFDDTPVAYADIAFEVARAVVGGAAERAVLLCGTGIGMAIAANKVAGIRAAQCHDTYSAERASKSNDAQVITLGARVVGPELAKAIVDSFMNSAFAGGPSQAKIDRISEYENARPHPHPHPPG